MSQTACVGALVATVTSLGWMRAGSRNCYQKTYTRGVQVKVGHTVRVRLNGRLSSSHWVAMFDGIFLGRFESAEAARLQVDQTGDNWIDQTG